MPSFQRIVVVSSRVSTFPARGAVLHLIFYDFIIWQAGQRRASVPAQRPAGTRLTLSQKDQQHKHSEKPAVNNKKRGEESFVENNLRSSKLTLPVIILRASERRFKITTAHLFLLKRSILTPWHLQLYFHVLKIPLLLITCLTPSFLLMIYKVKLRWLDSSKMSFPKAAPQKRSFDHQWQSRLPSCHQRAPKARESELMP